MGKITIKDLIQALDSDQDSVEKTASSNALEEVDQTIEMLEKLATPDSVIDELGKLAVFVEELEKRSGVLDSFSASREERSARRALQNARKRQKAARYTVEAEKIEQEAARILSGKAPKMGVAGKILAGAALLGGGALLGSALSGPNTKDLETAYMQGKQETIEELRQRIAAEQQRRAQQTQQ